MSKNNQGIFNSKTGKYELTIDLLKQRGWTDNLIHAYLGFKELYNLHEVIRVEDKVKNLFKEIK